MGPAVLVVTIVVALALGSAAGPSVRRLRDYRRDAAGRRGLNQPDEIFNRSLYFEGGEPHRRRALRLLLAAGAILVIGSIAALILS